MCDKLMISNSSWGFNFSQGLNEVEQSKAGSRLVAYPCIISVWTVPHIILPLQNVDTVILNGLFAQLVVFSRRIKGTTRVAVVPVWTCTRCIALCLSAPHKGQLERCISWYAMEIRYGDTQQVWTWLNSREILQWNSNTVNPHFNEPGYNGFQM
jgi:hypothetical protein